MPRVGTRKATARRLERTSKIVISGLSTPFPRSPTPFHRFLHLELMKMASLLILGGDHNLVLLQAAALHMAFQQYHLTHAAYSYLVSITLLIRRRYLVMGPAIGSLLDNINLLRYLEPRIHNRSFQIQESQFRRVFDGCDRTFMKLARMSKEKFNILVGFINLHPIFHNSSNVPQSPVQWQLLVMLTNLGLSGNGGSAYIIALMFSISEGTVHNFTFRCLKSILTLETNYVYWPDSEGCQNIKAAIGHDSAFKDCVGLIDGTLIPLTFAPQKDPEDYWTCKFFYAFNLLLVCDHEGRIIYALHGWCGSAHDQRVFASSRLAQHPEEFFLNREYLLANSGYTCTNHIIPTYKRCHSRTLDPNKQDFNTHLSKKRVTVEHCNGMLKAQFQSLRACHIIVKGAKTAIKFNNWIQVCCILHNFLIKESDIWEPGPGEDEPFICNPPNYFGEVFAGPSSFSQCNSLLQEFILWNADVN